MYGLGFYIWKIKDCPPARAIPVLERAGARWVCIKAANGIEKYNQVGPDGRETRNDRYLLEYIALLKAAGYAVGIWTYIYPNPTLSPGAQAGVIGERYQKLGANFILIDAEHDTKQRAYWKFLADGTLNPQRKSSATTFMNQLRTAGIPLRVPVALSSYRFPKIHGEFPHKQFVNHESSNFIAQQMYWVGQHNPGEQLRRSISEYNTLVRAGLPPLPFTPIGSAYRQGTWEPTAADIREFVQTAKAEGCPGWGFWSLDWILNNNRMDWIDAMVTEIPEPTPEPTPEPPAEGSSIRYRIGTAASWMNVRPAPNSPIDLGNLYPGTEVEICDIGGGDAWGQIMTGEFAGNWVLIERDKRYLEKV